MIHINVTQRKVTVVEKEPLVSGSVNTYFCQISFSPDWEDLDKTVIFRAGGTKVRAEQDGDGWKVPWEVLAAPGYALSIGVKGTRGEDVIYPTTWQELGYIHPGAAGGDEPDPPPTDMVAQILRASQQAMDTANSVRKDADNGKIQGPPGDDYVLTEADKQEIAGKVGLTDYFNKSDTGKTEIVHSTAVFDHFRLRVSDESGENNTVYNADYIYRQGKIIRLPNDDEADKKLATEKFVDDKCRKQLMEGQIIFAPRVFTDLRAGTNGTWEEPHAYYKSDRIRHYYMHDGDKVFGELLFPNSENAEMLATREWTTAAIAQAQESGIPGTINLVYLKPGESTTIPLEAFGLYLVSGGSNTNISYTNNAGAQSLNGSFVMFIKGKTAGGIHYMCNLATSAGTLIPSFNGESGVPSTDIVITNNEAEAWAWMFAIPLIPN